MMGEAVRQSKRAEQRRTVLGLLQLLDTPPREVAGLQHLALLLQAVNEWLCLVGGQGRTVQRTLEQVQADYHLNERFVAWLHAAIRLADVHSYGNVYASSVGALEAVCRVAGRADRWVQLAPVLRPTLIGLPTCKR